MEKNLREENLGERVHAYEIGTSVLSTARQSLELNGQYKIGFEEFGWFFAGNMIQVKIRILAEESDVVHIKQRMKERTGMKELMRGSG